MKSKNIILSIFLIAFNHNLYSMQSSQDIIPTSTIETWQDIKKDVTRADLLERTGQKINKKQALKRILKRMVFATTAIIIAIKGNSIPQDLIKPLEELRNNVDKLYKKALETNTSTDIQEAITQSRILTEKTGEFADQIINLLQKKTVTHEFKEQKEVQEEISSETIEALKRLKSDIENKQRHIANIIQYKTPLNPGEAGTRVDDVRRLVKEAIATIKSLNSKALAKDLSILDSEYASLEKSLDAIERSSNKKGYIDLYKRTCVSLLKKAKAIIENALNLYGKS
jgi:hypothetical protein